MESVSGVLLLDVLPPRLTTSDGNTLQSVDGNELWSSDYFADPILSSSPNVGHRPYPYRPSVPRGFKG